MSEKEYLQAALSKDESRTQILKAIQTLTDYHVFAYLRELSDVLMTTGLNNRVDINNIVLTAGTHNGYVLAISHVENLDNIARIGDSVSMAKSSYGVRKEQID
jgi:hypothetical protein